MPGPHCPQARAAAKAQVSTAVHFGLFFIKIKRINLGVAELAPACQETAADSASACPAPSARMAEGTKPKQGQRIKTLTVIGKVKL